MPPDKLSPVLPQPVFVPETLIIVDCVFVFEAILLPVVQVNVWSGISLENKKKVVEGITRVLEEIGVPREAVTVIICEEPKENWASGGKLHSERFANQGPQP